MSLIAKALLVAGPALAGPVRATPPPPADSLVGPGLEVPFLSQEPLLCGGAAAAMVERFWGARGVWAEDFAHLVREEEGGIRTDDLAAELSRRGWDVEVRRDDPSVLADALREGVPPLLLIDAGGPVLHYVVVVRSGTDSTWIHDPADGPARATSRVDLLRRWARAGHWAAVVRPGERARTVPAATPAGVHEATPAGTAAPGPRAPTSPEVARGIEALRTGDAAAARRSARRLLERGVAPELAWRMLATARWLSGERDGALAAWNRLGEPRLDLVRIEGLHHTRHRTVERLLPLRHGDMLTPRDVALARRRVDAVPAVAAARLEVRPLPDGSAEVRVHTLERPRWPLGRTGAAALAIGALVNHRARVEAGPFLGAGDRWELAGGWEPALGSARFGVRSAAPPLPGIVGVALDWRRSRFGREGGAGTTEERIRAEASLSEWIHAKVRLRGALGLERWRERGRLATTALELDLLLAGDRVRLSTGARGWAGRGGFGRGSLRVRARLPHGSLLDTRLDGGLAVASSSAPATAWWGAGTGRVSDVLLRGHPLVRDGRIAGPAFGRGLMHASVEHGAFRRHGPLRIGAAVFVDVARVSRPLAGREARTFLDFGAGLRAGSQERTLFLDLARGGSDWVLSARIGARMP